MTLNVLDNSLSVEPAIGSDARVAAARALDTARSSAGLTELFGTFVLGGEEFAIAAARIREVVNFPARIMAVPLSPPELEGIFTLRGHVIPVLNLARIFAPGAPPLAASSKIAIVDHGDVQIGIAFDQLGEVLRVRPEQRSAVQYREAGRHAVILGTIQLDQGARLLQILDPHALVSIENVPQVQALRASGRGADKNDFLLKAEHRRCLSFSVSGVAFALDMSAIREIIRVPELKASVMASALCIGRINFRGHPVAVIDVAALLKFGAAGAADADAKRILVAHIGATFIGLLVDSVDDIFNFSDADLLPIPLLSSARAGMFAGYVARAGGAGDVLFLDHKEIFSNTELGEIGAGHVNLYRDEARADGANAAHEQKKLRRDSYIIFTSEGNWAVEIKQLREIIPYSAKLIRPPGMPDFVHGVLKLREQVVLVIDLRSLNRLPSLADYSAARIMIVETGGERIGIVVDTVANIVSVGAGERRSTPRMGRGDSALAQAAEVITLAHAPEGENTAAVFDCEAFFAQVRSAIA